MSKRLSMDRSSCNGLANVLMHHSYNLYQELKKELEKRKLNVVYTGDGPRLVTSTKARRSLASLENVNATFKRKCIVSGAGYDVHNSQMRNIHARIEKRAQDMREDFQDILY